MAKKLSHLRQLGRFSLRFLGGFLFVILLIFYLKNFPLPNKTRLSKSMTKKESKPRQENILFLKTHKTGSSTITNILNRYGEKKGLRVALPQEGMFNFFWPFAFHVSFVSPTKRKANILCNHARYNRNAMKSFMPDNTTFITILRNPVSQFESVFSYMQFKKLLGLEKTENPMDVFLENPQVYLRKLTENPDTLIAYPYLNLLKNGQFFDLGMESTDFYDDNKIANAIRQIDVDFHLVLIMEHFDESLVLLARELGWSVEDVVYFKQNQRRLSDKSSILSKESTIKLREWSNADFMLYAYFNKTFWKKIGEQDSSFWTEVNLLKSYNVALEKECLVPGEHIGKVYEKQAKSIQGFKLKKTINFELFKVCQRMITNEIDYMEYFRKKQHSDPRR